MLKLTIISPCSSSSISLLRLHCPNHKKTFIPDAHSVDIVDPAITIQPSDLQSKDNTTAPSKSSVAPHANMVDDDIEQDELLIPSDLPLPSETRTVSEAVIANCSGCGKVGAYKVISVMTASQTGTNKAAYKRHIEHRVPAPESGKGKLKYCGQFSVNPRPAISEIVPPAVATRPTVQVIGLASNEVRLGNISEEASHTHKSNEYEEPPAVAPFPAIRPPTDFAPGMDAGECTVQVCWQSPEELTETDIQELFAPFGHVFKSEMDTEHKSAVLCYSERKAALTAATKYSKFINDPSKVDRRISKNSVFQKMFCIQTTQLGAEVFVGGLDSGVTTVKLKRGKQL